MKPIITLTTDFGLQDPYVGMMKGAILSVHPEAAIVDITHQIHPQAVDQAANVIHSAYGYFPAGAIHVVVVDPGVGGDRGIIALKADGHVFLAPDNGVLTRILETGKTTICVRIMESRYFRPTVSRTFHGRDIFAPVAGHIATGLAPEALGTIFQPEEAVRIAFPKTSIKNETEIIGAVISIDRFGNLITNIHADILTTFLQLRLLEKHMVAVRIGECVISGLQSCYQDAPAGQPLALVGSNGYLEIALNRGDARGYCQAKQGDPVVVYAK